MAAARARRADALIGALSLQSQRDRGFPHPHQGQESPFVWDSYRPRRKMQGSGNAHLDVRTMRPSASWPLGGSGTTTARTTVGGLSSSRRGYDYDEPSGVTGDRAAVLPGVLSAGWFWVEDASWALDNAAFHPTQGGSSGGWWCFCCLRTTAPCKQNSRPESGADRPPSPCSGHPG